MHADPRRLCVAVRTPCLSLNVCVMHAPCMHAKADVEWAEGWWQETANIVGKWCERARAPLVVLLDANGRVGS
eukprot:7195620-Alexandrium_andersonii.AAC.1